MKVLKVQPWLDPRSYKLVRSIESTSSIRVTRAIYSKELYSDFYASYSGDAIPIGPHSLSENRLTRKLNHLTYQSNLLFWPLSRTVSRKISRAAESTGAQLLHTNGSPDVFGVLGKRRSGLPVVHEVYDLESLLDFADRRKKPMSLENNPLTIALSTYSHRRVLDWEEFVHKRCDALVYTSDEMRHVAQQRYGQFKSVVVPNGVLKEFLPHRKREKLGTSDGRIHCVYLGAIRSSIPHRRIIPYIHQLAGQSRIVLHLYPVMAGRVEIEAVKEELRNHRNVIVHPPLHYRQLHEEITQYDINPLKANLRAMLPFTVVPLASPI